MRPPLLNPEDPRVQECLHRLATPPYTTAGAIAQLLGVTPKTVHNALHRWGWAFDHRTKRWISSGNSWSEQKRNGL